MVDVPFPICFKHAYRLFRCMAETVRAAERDDLRILSLAMRGMDEDREREARRQEAAVVYYVQVGDLCKIGTTTNLKRRLVGYPPNRKLLATEPGSYEVEARRHAQFAALLDCGKEWFRLEAPLAAHIQQLRPVA